MGKRYDAAKERYWRGVLRRQTASGLTAGRFCARERIAVHQFYWWRRALQVRDRRSGETVGAVPNRRRGRAPVESPFLAMPLAVSFSAPIEVVHPRGHVLRVPARFDAAVLRHILAMLDVPAAPTGEA
jgi:hypothetical protein